MTELKVFNHEDFGGIRVFEKDGEPWFVGKDVAETLGYGDTNQAIRKHVDTDDKLTRQFDGSGQNRNMTCINESGLYSLILGSKLPKAKEFKRWVTSDVLPTIRKTGGYVGNEDLFVGTYLPFADDATKELFKTTLAVIRQQNQTIAEQKKEIIHKEDVIIGLVDDISLAEKRQILNRVVRKTTTGNYAERYRELYKQFEMKYQCNLKKFIQRGQKQ